MMALTILKEVNKQVAIEIERNMTNLVGVFGWFSLTLSFLGVEGIGKLVQFIGEGGKMSQVIARQRFVKGFLRYFWGGRRKNSKKGSVV